MKYMRFCFPTQKARRVQKLTNPKGCCQIEVSGKFFQVILVKVFFSYGNAFKSSYSVLLKRSATFEEMLTNGKVRAWFIHARPSQVMGSTKSL